jgi:hypothetical protein
MKKLFLFILISVSFFGCDSVYEYIFLPPGRVEHTLVPDGDLLNQLSDTSYFVSRDGLTVGYDAKDWKFEIKYMSDYQLNNFEFPDDSKSAEFSGNPYTYANWIDKELGYTPRRFSVFKVSIYNYTGSKLNYDPELSLLQTDRGDYFHAYGREQKSAKYVSIEEYYQRRKGTSGVDEDIYETRMGIARRTMLYYGKPIYKGDSREGLIIFDPIVDNVEKLKISVRDFVIGYDENNDPSDFIDLTFYFKQVPFERGKTSALSDSIFVEKSDTSDVLSGTVRIAHVKYNNNLELYSSEEINSRPQIRNNPWDPSSGSFKNFIGYIEQNSDLDIVYDQVDAQDPILSDYNILFITGIDAYPGDNTFGANLGNAISNGSVLFMDIAQFTGSRRRIDTDRILKEIAKSVSGTVEIKNVNLDHPVFSSWKKISEIPEGYERENQNIEPSNTLRGLFLNGKLSAIIAKKSYPMLWINSGNTSQLDFGVNLVIYALKN